MPIKEKRKYLRWFFCASFGFAVLILFVFIIGSFTVSELGKESAREKEFDAHLTETRKAYEDAISLGTRKMIGENFNGDIQHQRAAALEQTDTMLRLAGENFTQADGINTLRSLFAERFETQNAQYATMKRTEAGDLIYNDEIIKKTVQLNGQINDTFVRLRQNSTELFRAKHARIIGWQKFLSWFGLSGVVMLIISLAVLYYYNVKQLDKSDTGGNWASDLAKTSTTDVVIIPKVKIEKFAQYLREETPDLEII